MKKTQWLWLMVIILLSGCASPPTMPSKPKIEAPKFQLEVLQDPSIQVVCYHQGIVLPQEEIATQTRLLIEDLIETSGLQVKSVAVGETEKGLSSILVRYP